MRTQDICWLTELHQAELIPKSKAPRYLYLQSHVGPPASGYRCTLCGNSFVVTVTDQLFQPQVA